MKGNKLQLIQAVVGLLSSPGVKVECLRGWVLKLGAVLWQTYEQRVMWICGAETVQRIKKNKTKTQSN